jgi:hypothetical protein
LNAVLPYGGEHRSAVGFNLVFCFVCYANEEGNKNEIKKINELVGRIEYRTVRWTGVYTADGNS